MKYFKYISIILVVVIVAGIIIFIHALKSSSSKIVVSSSPSSSPVSKINLSTNFSLEKAPSQSLRGSITTMSGEINWQDRIATEASKINSPIEIQQGENLITGKGSNLELSFANVCNLVLSENTEVDIIQTLPSNIVFSQLNGTVDYKKIGGYPITIRTSYLLTSIDGEVSIVRDTEKLKVIVTVKSGGATFAYNDSKLVSHVINAIAGQTYTFNYGTRKGVLENI